MNCFISKYMQVSKLLILKKKTGLTEQLLLLSKEGIHVIVNAAGDAMEGSFLPEILY